TKSFVSGKPRGQLVQLRYQGHGVLPDPQLVVRSHPAPLYSEPGTARLATFLFTLYCFCSSSLTSVNSASTTSSPPCAAPPDGCSPPAASCWAAAATAANSDWLASSRALDLASIWPLSSPFIAVSSSAIAASAVPMTSPPTLSPLSLIALRVAWIRASAWLRACT